MKKLTRFAALALTLAAAACSKEKVCAPDELQDANGACVAAQADPRNCGAIGRACDPGQGCSAGTCVDCASSPGLCATAIVAACYNLDQVRPLGADLSTSGAPLNTDDGPGFFARLDTTGALYVANSGSSTLSALILDPPHATTGTDAIPVPSEGAGFSDLEGLASHDGLLWVSNAATNTLVVIDPTGAAPTDELAFGDFTNPHGVAFHGSKAYVTLTDVNAVAVVDDTVRPRVELKRIDLAPLAYPGAQAKPVRALAVGDRIYVVMNDIGADFKLVSGAHGRLAVIDTTTDTVAGDAIDLGADCLDPGGLAVNGTTLWVGCGYYDFFGTKTVSGGAIVPVELGSGTPVVGTPIKLTNVVGTVTFCDGHGYAGASESGTVIAFDPGTRAVASAAACPVPDGQSSFVADVACAH
jgi:DNA-binding beta-propeller fold protein YncE